MTPEEISAGPERRMSKGDRREQILDAAVAVVARSGYAGTSTDDIARAAGVSQPYVVRTFGGKLPLFVALFERAGQNIVDAFLATPDDEAQDAALGHAYVELMKDRDNLLVLMHSFTAGADPELAAVARRTVADVYRVLRDRFGNAQAAADFFAQGMLINVLLSVGAPQHLQDDADLAELTFAVCGKDLPAITAHWA
ncbi:MAG: TetR/AcrR family transcriptional regulator [Janthinobacterium lividum]